MHELERIVAAAREAAAAGEPSAIATILWSHGSSFRRPGSRVWIGRGRRIGAISGGCLEADLAERAPRVLETGRSALVSYDTAGESDVLWGTASGCGGALEILLERADRDLLADLEWMTTRLAQRQSATLVTSWDGRRITRTRDAAEAGFRSGRTAVARDGATTVLAEVHHPPIALTIFGGGPDAEATRSLAERLGWDVRDGAEGEVPEDPLSAALVMTHNFYRDADLLASLRGRTLGYLAVLGPRSRTARVLAQAGLIAEDLPVLRTPPGLDIGGETPEEIALSLVAEIQAVLARRSGGPLHDHRGPIHDEVERIEIPLAAGTPST